MPAEILPNAAQPDDIYIVVDVIRATTTLAVMLSRGAARVLVAETVEQAREAAQIIPGRLLCGERNVKRIPGFDYGNSPVQYSQLDLARKELILTTTNGTRAFYACPEGTIRLAGSFYNARAVTERALALAQERQSNIALVCSGEFSYFALDDAICAGYLAFEIQRQNPEIYVQESARAAIALYQSPTAAEMIEHSQSARSVIEAGLQEDVAFCMQRDGCTSVPMVVGREEETGLLVVEENDVHEQNTPAIP